MQNNATTPRTSSELKKFDFEQKAIFAAKKEAKVKEYTEYLQQNKVLQHMMHDFMAAVLLHKPENIYEFANQHFAAMARPNTAAVAEMEKQMKHSIRHLIIITGAYSHLFSGKTELIHYLKQDFPDYLEHALSFTTRMPREDEVHGVHYYFVTKEEYVQRDENITARYTSDDFVMYGVAMNDVQAIWDKKMAAMVFVNMDGLQALKEEYETKTSKCFSIFVQPPPDFAQDYDMERAADCSCIIEHAPDAYEKLKKSVHDYIMNCIL